MLQFDIVAGQQRTSLLMKAAQSRQPGSAEGGFSAFGMALLLLNRVGSEQLLYLDASKGEALLLRIARRGFQRRPVGGDSVLQCRLCQGDTGFG